MNLIFEPGRIVKGKVTGIKKYGIFVSFENEYTGMIHISEISENFVKDLNDYARIGELIPCKILEVKKEDKKAKLTIKNLDYMMNIKKTITYLDKRKIRRNK